MESAEINITSHSPSNIELFSELINSGQYEHLRLILHRNNNREFGQNYLYVSKDAYAKVKLVDLDFVDNHIYIELQDCTTGMFIHQSIDVEDKEFKFLLISWQDIRQMVMDKSQSKFNNQDLLEFDY
jgi:hypothetical protein